MVALGRLFTEGLHHSVGSSAEIRLLGNTEEAGRLVELGLVGGLTLVTTSRGVGNGSVLNRQKPRE